MSRSLPNKWTERFFVHFKGLNLNSHHVFISFYQQKSGHSNQLIQLNGNGNAVETPLDTAVKEFLSCAEKLVFNSNEAFRVFEGMKIRYIHREHSRCSVDFSKYICLRFTSSRITESEFSGRWFNGTDTFSTNQKLNEWMEAIWTFTSIQDGFNNPPDGAAFLQLFFCLEVNARTLSSRKFIHILTSREEPFPSTIVFPQFECSSNLQWVNSALSL